MLSLPFYPSNYNYNSVWLWIDIETTGLDPRAENFGILEIAAVITDCDLHVRDRLHVVIRQEDRVLNSSSNWCKSHFKSRSEGGNDLFQQCKASTITESEAGKMLGEFITKHAARRKPQTNERRDVLLSTTGDTEMIHDSDPQSSYDYYRVICAGTSVYFDRNVLLLRFPYLKHLIGHKTVDITSLLEVTRRWRPDIAIRVPRPDGVHRALQDITSSIQLAKFIWRTCFRV